MADGPIEQRHHVLMGRARVVIQRDEALSGWHKPVPYQEWRIARYLHGDQPGKATFNAVWRAEAAAPTRQRQRRYETMATTVLETALDPGLAVGYTISSIRQQLDVAKRCLIRGVKWHASPPCQITAPTLCGLRKGIKSRISDADTETRLPLLATEPLRVRPRKPASHTTTPIDQPPPDMVFAATISSTEPLQLSGPTLMLMPWASPRIDRTLLLSP